jgi:hypothetical protein
MNTRLHSAAVCTLFSGNNDTFHLKALMRKKITYNIVNIFQFHSRRFNPFKKIMYDFQYFQELKYKNLFDLLFHFVLPKKLTSLTTTFREIIPTDVIANRAVFEQSLTCLALIISKVI